MSRSGFEGEGRPSEALRWCHSLLVSPAFFTPSQVLIRECTWPGRTFSQQDSLQLLAPKRCSRPPPGQGPSALRSVPRWQCLGRCFLGLSKEREALKVERERDVERRESLGRRGGRKSVKFRRSAFLNASCWGNVKTVEGPRFSSRLWGRTRFLGRFLCLQTIRVRPGPLTALPPVLTFSSLSLVTPVITLGSPSHRGHLPVLRSAD